VHLRATVSKPLPRQGLWAQSCSRRNSGPWTRERSQIKSHTLRGFALASTVIGYSPTPNNMSRLEPQNRYETRAGSGSAGHGSLWTDNGK
jgi:hypothetical protein